MIRYILIIAFSFFLSNLSAQITKNDLIGFNGSYSSFDGEKFVEKRNVNFIDSSLCRWTFIIDENEKYEILTNYKLQQLENNNSTLCLFSIIEITHIQSNLSQKQDFSYEIQLQWENALNSKISFIGQNNSTLRFERYIPDGLIFIGEVKVFDFVSKVSK